MSSESFRVFLEPPASDTLPAASCTPLSAAVATEVLPALEEERLMAPDAAASLGGVFKAGVVAVRDDDDADADALADRSFLAAR